MNPQLTKLLTLLDPVIAAGEERISLPWKVTGTDYKEDRAYIKIRGTQLGQKWKIADIPFLKQEGYSEEPEAQQIADTITLSDNLSPLMAETLKSEIDYLQGILELRPSSFPGSDSWNAGHNSLLSAVHKSVEIRLTTILNKWKHLL